MSRHQSAEDVEREYREVLLPTLGPLYHALCDEVTWVHAKWLEYRKLFAKSEYRVSLLNRSGGFFFRVIQKALWEDVLLHIARLTDPPEQGRRRNLTLRCLPDAVPDADVTSILNEQVELAIKQSAFAREWRNKRLAHIDFTLAVDSEKVVSLPGISRQHIEDVLHCFRSVMNTIQMRYLNAEMAFDHFISHDDAESVVYYLAAGLDSEERRRRRLQTGSISQEDISVPRTE